MEVARRHIGDARADRIGGSPHAAPALCGAVVRSAVVPPLTTAPVVCADAAHADRLALALLENRRLAWPGLRVEVPTGLATRFRFPPIRDGPADVSVLGLGADEGLDGDPARLLRCRELLLVATGAKRADALHAALTGPVDPAAPASLLRAHPRLTVLCDPPSATRLPGAAHRAGDHVAIVLGHRWSGISAEHRISHESFERLHRAERLVRRRPTRAVLLTGYSATGGLSEAEQMALAWRDPAVPFLLEVAGRDTAENATRSLALLLALGGVHRVSVVTSAWHVRAPWFFAPYGRYGLEVTVRREWRGGAFARMLADELRKAPRAPAQRRHAWAAVR